MKLSQTLKPSYWEPVEKQLEGIFYAVIFQPLIEIIEEFNEQMVLAKKELTNANDEVVRDALRSGRIQYAMGVFSGQFSAAIGKSLRGLGARFSAHRKVYTLEPSKVPGWVSAEAGVYKVVSRDAHNEIKKVLGYVQDTLDESIDKYSVGAAKAIDGFEKGFEPIAQKLTVHPNLSQDSKARLTKEYTENMKLWIRKFSEESIQDLRVSVDKNANEGYRFDRLIDMIQARYGVAQSKAKFLARQETSLFMAKYRKSRFGEAGVTRYKWSTSHDERVRADHKHLNGRTFFYSDPPIVDTATGRRAGPGEDFNCRCVDIPILDPVEAHQEAAA